MNRWAVSRRRALAWPAAMLLVTGWAVPAATQETKAPAPPAAAADILHDSNSNKILDNLDARLDRAAAGERIPVIVRFTDQIAADRLHKAVGAFPAGRAFDFIGALSTTLTPGQVRAAARQPFVAQMELNGVVHAVNDLAGNWFGAGAAGADHGVDGDRDGNPASYSAADLVVAVVDTGIDAGHVDLDGGKVIGWYDVVRGQSQPYDDNGHGSHVAGTIAGTGQGNAAYRGVAPGAALVGVKVLDSQGSGSWDGVLAGVQWVIDHKDVYGIEVMSLSLGGGTCSDGSDSISQAMDAAADAGIVPVVAAGNSGPKTCTVGSPAASRKAITVGAAADVGEGGFFQAYFSSRGPTGDGRIKPDISAPGWDIMSVRANSGNGYVEYDGTSMATPYVSGVVALLLDYAQDTGTGLTPQQVKDRIMGTAVDWGPAGADIDFGAGMLDAYRAVGNGTTTKPARPPHQRYVEGSLGGTGDSDWYDLNITDTGVPVAVTLVHKTGDGSSPDFDLYLYKPGSTGYVTRAYTYNRQETISWWPDVTGNWRLEVRSYSGSGGYWFDTSMGSSTPDAAPGVTVDSPADGSVVSGTAVSVAGSATDDHGVAGMSWSIDGGAATGFSSSECSGLGTATAACATDWNSTGVADGTHTVTITATDTAGQSAGASVTVTVDNMDGAPTAAINSPNDGAVVSGAVTIAAGATDDNAVAGIEYQIDAGGWTAIPTASCSGLGTTGATCSQNWVTGSDGSHTISVRSTDSAGQYSTAASVTVTVDNTAPGVSVDTPADGSEVSGTIVVQGSASDPNGIEGMWWSIDGGAWQGFSSCTYSSDGTSATCTASWNSTLVANGGHTIGVRAADGAVNYGTASAAITVNNGTTSQTWNSGDLETGVWSNSGNPNGKSSRKDYSFTPTLSGTMSEIRVLVEMPVYLNYGTDPAPYLTAGIVAKGSEYAIGASCAPVQDGATSRWLCTFSGTDTSRIQPGSANSLRVTVHNLYKRGGNTDRVDVDVVIVEIDYAP